MKYKAHKWLARTKKLTTFQTFMLSSAQLESFLDHKTLAFSPFHLLIHSAFGNISE